MLNNNAKNIIIKALRIRKDRGEAPMEVLKTYTNLSEDEKAELLKEVDSR